VYTTANTTLTLLCSQPVQSKLHEKSEPILCVSETAGKEFAIESSLNKMRDAWAAVTLQVLSIVTTFSLHVVSDCSRIYAMSKSVVICNPVSSSKHADTS
jgi:hypothetical protein